MQAVAENFPIIVTALLLSFALCWWGLTHYALAAKSQERSDVDGTDVNGSDAEHSEANGSNADLGRPDANRAVTAVRGNSIHTASRSTTRRAAGRHRAFKQAGRISAELKSMAALHTQIRQTQQTRAALGAPDQTTGINSARLKPDSILIDDTPDSRLSEPTPTGASGLFTALPKTDQKDGTAKAGDIANTSANLSVTATNSTVGSDNRRPAIADTTAKKNQSSTPDPTPTITGVQTGSGLQTVARKDTAVQQDSERTDVAARAGSAEAGNAGAEATSNSGAVISKTSIGTANKARPATQTGVSSRLTSANPFANNPSAQSDTSSATTQNAGETDKKPGLGSTATKPMDENASAGTSDKSSAANNPSATSATPAHASDANKLDKVVRAPLPPTESTTAATDGVAIKATAQSNTANNAGDSSSRADRETAPSIAAYQLRREQLKPGYPQHGQDNSGSQTTRITELKTPGSVAGADDSSSKPNSAADTSTPLNTDSIATAKRPNKGEQKDTEAERYQTAAKLMPTAPTDEARLQVKAEEINRVTTPAQPAPGATTKTFIRPTASPDKESATTETQVNKTAATEATEATEATVKTDNTPDKSATVTSARTSDSAATNKTSATGATESSTAGAATDKPVNNLLAAVKQASNQASTPAADTAQPTGSLAAFNDASDLENTLALEAKDQLIKDLQAQLSALRSDQSAAQPTAPGNSDSNDYQQQLADTKEALQLSQQKVGKLQLTLKAVQSRQSGAQFGQAPTTESVSTHKPHGRPALSSKVRLLEADTVVRESAQR